MRVRVRLIMMIAVATALAGGWVQFSKERKTGSRTFASISGGAGSTLADPPGRTAAASLASTARPKAVPDGGVKMPRPLVFGLNGPVTLEDVPAGRFKDALETLSAASLRFALARLEKLHVPLNDVRSLDVDRAGRLFYRCERPAQLAQSTLPSAAEIAPPRIASAVVLANSGDALIPPPRHSRPGAARVIYLDFNGQLIIGTAWNEDFGVEAFVAQPYDTDGDPGGFGAEEQAAILNIWERVAEDYRGFDVDVTTEEPAAFTATTGRVLITSSLDANGVNLPHSANAAGVAYLDVFGGPDYVAGYSPAFVYARRYDNTAFIAEVASHEMGHNLSLAHDGTSLTEYYAGHGTGETSWGPIMGANYGKFITQWSKGEYFDANNPQDDLALLARHLGYVPADHADNAAAATLLESDGANLSGHGVIGQTGENDCFAFSVAAGTVTLTASPFRSVSGTNGGNLDLGLELRDAANAVLAMSDASDGLTSASLVATVPGGTYYLYVTGRGCGLPLVKPPSGYTNYGSLGQYTITGTATAEAAIAPRFISPPADQIVNAGEGVALTAYASGNPAPSYRWQRLRAGEVLWSNLTDEATFSGTGTAFLSIGLVPFAMNRDQLRCVATNSAGTATSTGATLTVNAAYGVAPTISNLPASCVVNFGDYFFIGATITGTSPMSYRWKKDGVDLPNGSYRFYFKDGATPADNGSYTLMAENAMGAVTSGSVVVTVGEAVLPTITSLPGSFALNFGDYLYLSPIITGTIPVTYQWKKDGQILPEATNRTFAKSNAMPGDSGRYTLSATNPVGTVTSVEVDVAVGAAVVNSIILPGDVTVGYGETLEIYPLISGTKPTAYQWKKDGTAVAGATSRNFFKANVTAVDSGRYTLTVTNPVGTVTSAPLTIAVRPAIAPIITQQPESLDVAFGLTANFSVTAAGTNPLGYQWKLNGQALAGATGGTLTVANVQEANLGRYTVVVTNPGGATTSATAVLARSPLRGVVSADAGGAHNIFIQAGGSLWAMGRNDFGQLGDGTAVGHRNQVKVADQVATAVAGDNHTLLVKADGTLWTTGNNEFGQLGDGTTSNRARPVQITGSVVAAAAGFAHSFFITSDGTLWGMGQNSVGQLGDGSKTDRARAVPITDGVVAAAAGTAHSLFIKADGTLWATGSNSDGQLGDGRTLSRASPLQVGTEVVAVSAGTAHSLFLKSDRTLWAMGYNYSGQLGDGTLVSRRNPVQVATDVVAIAAGWSHSLFIKSDGTLWAMGANGNGQLGDGTIEKRTRPVLIATQVAAASAGPFHSLFLKTDGTLWVMGLNADGQLGDGTLTSRNIPLPIAQGALAVPAAPTGLTVSEGVRAPGFRITWDPTLDAARYEVWRNTVNDAASATKIAVAVPLALYHDFAATLGTRYFYWIKAVTVAGDSGPFSTSASGFSAAPPPTILTQPESRQVPAGAGVAFSVVAVSATPLSYQWQKDGVDLAGANAATYTITSAQVADAGAYVVIVSNGGAAVTSASASLRVGVIPEGFDVARYLGLNPAVAAEYGADHYGAWLHFRERGIYNGEIFDEDFRVEEYLALYPELAAAFGSDLGAAMEHWLNIGRLEGRLGRIPLEFNATGYFDRNADVAAAVNRDPVLGWGHFWTYGIYGGRAYDDEFRVFEYLALNADLQAAFLNDWRGATMHWLRYGRTEGRLGRIPLLFNVDEYLARYPEVAATWGTYPTTVWLHFWLYGIDEGRNFDHEFRVDEYIALNPDVVAVIGNDRRRAFMHWVRYGRAEGRPGKNP